MELVQKLDVEIQLKNFSSMQDEEDEEEDELCGQRSRALRVWEPH